MLTPLQERVAIIISGLEEASDFALAGGAAPTYLFPVGRSTRWSWRWAKNGIRAWVEISTCR
jgi:hypothetical protein